MKMYDVEITETLQRTVSVEAASREEAERIVTEAWNDEVYVLDSTDIIDVDFKAVGERELSMQKTSVSAKLKDLQDAAKSSDNKMVSKPPAEHDR